MRFLLVGAVFAFAAGPIGESAAPATTSTWEGGDGDWNADASWDPDGAPDATDVDVEIDGGKTGTASTVTLNMDAKVQSLTIDDGDTLDMDDNRTFNVYGGGVTNNGTWNINCVAGNGQTYVFFRGSQTLDGAGILDLGTDRDGYLVVGDDADVITHGADHTIRGAGRMLGLSTASGGMVNNGTIIADGIVDGGEAHTLRIWPGTPGFTNAGTLQATGAGGLELRGSTFTNTGRTIDVAATSKLDLFNMTLVGGEISGAGEVLPGSQVDFDGVTIASGTTVDQAANTNIDIFNGLTNDGTWNLSGATAVDTILTVHGNHTLGGEGEVILSAHNRNRIRPSAAGEVITHGSDHTIRGGGRLLDNTGGMTNNGTILAEGSQQLVINPGDTDLDDVFTNAGTLRAVGSGGLKLQGGDVVNTGHTIEVADGALLELHSCVLKGGTLSAVGSHTGAIHVTENCDFGTVTVDTDTTVDQDNGVNVDIVSGLTNNGTWNLNSAGGNTGLFFDGTQMLDGTGEIVMSDNANNAVRGRSAGDLLTHGADHTIRGAGHVLWGAGSMLNLGTIIADASEDMKIDPAAPDTFTNQGLVEVVAGSRLTSNGTLTQTAGTTRVDGELGVTTLLDIQGGVLTGTGSISGQTNVAGTFDPGASVGTLTFDLLEILGGASYDFEIQGSASDLVHVSGTFVMDKDGPYSIDVICSGGVACLGEHDFFTWVGDDPIDWKDWGLLYQNTAISFSPGYDGDWSYSEAEKRMFVEITQTPEPATLALLALGGFGLLARRRKL
jgi:hypothetical protein